MAIVSVGEDVRRCALGAEAVELALEGVTVIVVGTMRGGSVVVENKVTPVVKHEADAVAIDVVPENDARILFSCASQSAVFIKGDLLASGDGDAVGIEEVAMADAVDG